MEIYVCRIMEAVSYNLQTGKGCLCYSFGDYVLSCGVCPISEGFVSTIDRLGCRFMVTDTGRTYISWTSKRIAEESILRYGMSAILAHILIISSVYPT